MELLEEKAASALITVQAGAGDRVRVTQDWQFCIPLTRKIVDSLQDRPLDWRQKPKPAGIGRSA